ncbi:MAG: hypothetical protein JNM18_21150 [Planctomycetaceae bacterium]|nr:hypothetical protein [Planctomycetaceae bacterium]
MNETQQEALKVLGEILALAPDLRRGQLMAHIGFLGESHIDRGLGYMDDDELIAVMFRHKGELLARLSGTTHPALPPTGTAVSLSGTSTLPSITGP